MDRRALLEHCLKSADFTAMSLMPGLFGGRFLDNVMSGCEINWEECKVPPDQADCVLAALGLLHMRVKCVIDEKCGGDYESEVSGMM